MSSRRQDVSVPRPVPRATAARPAPVRARRGLAAVVAGCGLALLPALPAAAHDELTGSMPADGASVELPPATVELTFSEPPLALGSQVQVTGPDGEVVNAGDLAITDTVVSQPLAAELPAGDYTVAWRVTSSDGHPISGELVFTAQDTTIPESPATPEPTPGATTEPAPAVTGEPSAPATTEPAPGSTTAAQAPDAPGVEDPSSGATPWVVGTLIVLLVGGTLWWLSRRRAGGGSAG